MLYLGAREFVLLAGIATALACSGDSKDAQGLAVSLQSSSSQFVRHLKGINKTIHVLPEAKNDPENFLKYIDEGAYFILELTDGTRWQIAASFLRYASAWQRNARITITHHAYEPNEPFKLTNLDEVDLWNNQQVVWGRPEGGLLHFDRFAAQSRRTIASTDENSSLITFDDGEQFQVENFFAIDMSHTYFIINNEDSEWPFALLDLSNKLEYALIEAKHLPSK